MNEGTLLYFIISFSYSIWTEAGRGWAVLADGREETPLRVSQLKYSPRGGPWKKTLLFSVADTVPGSGAFLTTGSGMGKKSGYGSGMNNLDHFFRAWKPFFWVKILKFFDADQGSGMEKILTQDGKQSDPG
jgi:hypothetical protein